MIMVHPLSGLSFREPGRPVRRKPSTRRFTLSRFAARRAAAIVALVATAAPCVASAGAATGVVTAAGFTAEVAVADVGRPIQLAFDRAGRLVVLGHGRRGDAAGEIHRFDVARALPVDAEGTPRIVIPFSQAPRKTALGSLTVDPRTDDIYLGEENGNRISRLSTDHRLTAVAVGLQHLVGGSSIALDGDGRLVTVDYASPETQGRAEVPPPPGLEALGTGYQGPLVFRVTVGEGAVLPRRLDLLPPFFPRGWIAPPGEPLTRFMAVAARTDGTLVLLDSLGQVFRLTGGGDLYPLARLPAGHYQRTSLAIARDGALFVSTGFHVRRLFRMSAEGTVTTIASELGDPNGVAVDPDGHIYVAETALHRVIRISPTRPQ
jgi:DNA-binding beta-propeller fold protein YncE